MNQPVVGQSFICGLRDPIFLILFLINIIVITYFAFTDGIVALSSNSSSSTSHISSEMKHLLGSFAILLIFASITSFVWLYILISQGNKLIVCSLWTNIFFDILAGILSAISGQYGPCILFLLFSVFTFLYFRAIQDRIPFASETISVACKSILNHPSVYFVAFFMIITSIAWFIIWSICVLGVYRKESGTVKGSDDSANVSQSISGLKYFGLLLSIYWEMQVFKNIIHCTVAGTVASWWFTPDVSSPVCGAFVRSITSSLGSICFGSLIVAILQTLRQLLREAASRGNALACCAECLIDCIANLMEYFNFWAFCYVGIYGYPFCQAGSQVTELFKRRGWTAVINDNLIDFVLTITSLVVGVLTSAVGLLIVYSQRHWFSDLAKPYSLMGLLGFIIGACLCSVTMNVVNSASATVFVCFADDPQALRNNHKQEYDGLVTSWNLFHPDLVIPC